MPVRPSTQQSARRRRLGAALVGALALLFGIDGIEQLYARSQLQELANNAAMAGVQALQDSAGRDDVQRQSIAMAASRAVTATVTGADVSVVASVAPIYVAVEVAQSSGWLRRINGRLNVVGQAGYLAPPRSRNVQQAQIPDSSRDAL